MFLFLTVVMQLLPAAAASCLPPPSGLVGWWTGDGNTRDIVNGNDATPFNGVGFAAGRVGNCFSFDGIDDRMQVPDVDVLKFNTSFSIECWAFIPSFPSPTNFFGLTLIAFRGDDQGGLDPYWLAIEAGGRAWFRISSSNAVEDLYAFVPTNRFIHLAATLEHSTGLMRLYLDGVLASQVTTAVRPLRELDPNSHPGLGIGNHPGFPTTPYNFPFKGRVDELSLYNRALTSNEVAAIFAAGASGKCRPGPTIRVNGQRVTGTNITVTDSAYIELLNNFETGNLRYSLDGSSPAARILYTGPFTVTRSVVLRAISTDASQTQSAESGPLSIAVNVLPHLSGVSDGETLVNPATVTLTASIGEVNGDNSRISIFDGNRLLIERPFTTNIYATSFVWADVPLGTHCLRVVVVDQDESFQERTRETEFPTCITVVGGQVGFSDILNLQTQPSVPNEDQQTAVAATLRIQNQTGNASNPLRVRLYLSQTYFHADSQSDNHPSVTQTFYPFSVSNASLASGASFSVVVPANGSIVCPASEFIDFSRSHSWQYHIFASLEELVGNKWTFIDRAKIFSSVPKLLFPFNDGVIGTDPTVNPLVDTNLFTFLTTLSILGNTNVPEGSIAAFVALAGLNDGSTGSVNAAWQSSQLSISSQGVITAPLVQTNTPINVVATFTRRTTRSATNRVTIINLGDPVTIIASPTNKVAGVGNNVTWSVTANGTAPRSYQWRKNGTNLVGATNQTLTLTNVQLASAGGYQVAVSNVIGAVNSSTGILIVVTRPLLSGAVSGSGGAFRFGVQGTPGSPCRIESSTNLPQWNFLSNFTLGVSPVMVTNNMVGPRRFFRVRIDTDP